MKEDKFLEAIGMVLIVVTISIMAFISSNNISKTTFGEATVGKAFDVTKIAISEGGLVGGATKMTAPSSRINQGYRIFHGGEWYVPDDKEVAIIKNAFDTPTAIGVNIKLGADTFTTSLNLDQIYPTNEQVEGIVRNSDRINWNIIYASFKNSQTHGQPTEGAAILGADELGNIYFRGKNSGVYRNTNPLNVGDQFPISKAIGNGIMITSTNEVLDDRGRTKTTGTTVKMKGNNYNIDESFANKIENLPADRFSGDSNILTVILERSDSKQVDLKLPSDKEKPQVLETQIKLNRGWVKTESTTVTIDKDKKVIGTTKYEPVFLHEGKEVSVKEAKKKDAEDPGSVKTDSVPKSQTFVEQGPPGLSVKPGKSQPTVIARYDIDYQPMKDKDGNIQRVASINYAHEGEGAFKKTKWVTDHNWIIFPKDGFEADQLSMQNGELLYKGKKASDAGFPASELGAVKIGEEGGIFKKPGAVQKFGSVSDDEEKIASRMNRQKNSQDFFRRMDFAITAYRGFGGFSTLIWGKEEMAKNRQEIDTAFCDAFMGGIDCWSSRICASQIDKVSDGTMLMEVPGAGLQPVAHVEAQRQTIQFSNTSGTFTDFIYKISFVVDNPTYWKWGSLGEGENLFFQVFLFNKNNRKVPLIREDNEDREVEPGDSVSFAGTSLLVIPSKNFYHFICLEFMDKGGKPVNLRLGVGGDTEEASKVCNTINELAPVEGFTPEGFDEPKGEGPIEGINPI